MGGISGLLSLVSLLGLGVFLIGIVLVVIGASQGRPISSGIGLAVVGLLLWIVLSIVSSGILVVEPTQIAVVSNSFTGQLEDPARASGTSILLPGIQSPTIYNLRQQEYTMSNRSDEGGTTDPDAVDATTIDGQQVQVDVTILYSVDRTKVNSIHQLYGNDPGEWIEKLIRPTARTVVRNVIATLQAVDIYGASRVEMQTKIEDQMRLEMETKGFTLDSFLVRGLTFSADFAKSIEDKEIAQQRVEEAEQQAERNRTQAQGEADAAILRAEGQRDSAIAIAEGQAQALSLVSAQIMANPALIQYEYIRNLSDNVNLILVPSNSPFLFDMNTLTNGEMGPLLPPVAEPTATPAP
ncbi:MAG: hypothetical protein H7Y11_09510 [Armatimonadetes bacterium]|nr:hypothetical protein [Anaerolineae bacterium]